MVSRVYSRYEVLHVLLGKSGCKALGVLPSGGKVGIINCMRCGRLNKSFEEHCRTLADDWETKDIFYVTRAWTRAVLSQLFSQLSLMPPSLNFYSLPNTQSDPAKMHFRPCHFHTQSLPRANQLLLVKV